MTKRFGGAKKKCMQRIRWYNAYKKQSKFPFRSNLQLGKTKDQAEEEHNAPTEENVLGQTKITELEGGINSSCHHLPEHSIPGHPGGLGPPLLVGVTWWEPATSLSCLFQVWHGCWAHLLTDYWTVGLETCIWSIFQKILFICNFKHSWHNLSWVLFKW